MKKYTLLIIILFLIISLFSFASLFIQTGRNSKEVLLEIKDGSSVIQIAEMLSQSNIIRSKSQFRILIGFFGFQKGIQSGFYKFEPHQTTISVISKLKNGETTIDDPLKVTFPEGTSIYKMGSILEKSGYPLFEEFRAYALSNNLEGYLFPDTYIITKTTPVKTIVKIMQNRFNEIIMPYWDKNQGDAKMDLYITLILASIIEKEAKHEVERKIISSVFYNRLAMKMPLAADPTIKYALERPTKHVYLKQVNVDSPYNTYKRRGLPPTPICNPGLASFKAAIYPESTKFIYFVARKDGSHIFSSSWEEHQRARTKVTPIQ